MQNRRTITLDVLGVIAFLAAAGMVSWRSYEWLRPVDAPKAEGLSAMCDFRDVVYFPARAALAGVNPYDGGRRDGRGYRDLYPAGNNFPVYGPLILYLSLPLAMLPLRLAEIVYWAANLGLLLGLVVVALRICGIRPRVGLIAGIGALLLLSRPGHANLYFGQVTLPIVLATLGAWNFAATRPWSSGLLLAAALIKPTFGVPLTVLMLARGDYRPVAIGVGVSIAAAGLFLAVLMANDPAAVNLATILIENQSETEADPNVDPKVTGNRIDLPLVVERLLGRRAAPVARYVLPLVVLGVAGYVLRRLARGGLGGDPGTSTAPLGSELALASSLLCVTIAICIYHGVYDGLVLTVPAVAACQAVVENRRSWRWLNILLVCCLMVPPVNYASSQQFIALLVEVAPPLETVFGGQSALRTFFGVLNGVSLTVAWCLLLAMTVAHLEARGAPAGRAAGPNAGQKR